MERGPNLGFPSRRIEKETENGEDYLATVQRNVHAGTFRERRRLVEDMSRHHLRKAQELTQTKYAVELHIGQGDVSKLERRTEMYVSTLAGYLQAVGADLEIRAIFPDGSTVVKISPFPE